MISLAINLEMTTMMTMKMTYNDNQKTKRIRRKQAVGRYSSLFHFARYAAIPQKEIRKYSELCFSHCGSSTYS